MTDIGMTATAGLELEGRIDVGGDGSLTARPTAELVRGTPTVVRSGGHTTSLRLGGGFAIGPGKAFDASSLDAGVLVGVGGEVNPLVVRFEPPPARQDVPPDGCIAVHLGWSNSVFVTAKAWIGFRGLVGVGGEVRPLVKEWEGDYHDSPWLLPVPRGCADSGGGSETGGGSDSDEPREPGEDPDGSDPAPRFVVTPATGAAGQWFEVRSIDGCPDGTDHVVVTVQAPNGSTQTENLLPHPDGLWDDWSGRIQPIQSAPHRSLVPGKFKISAECAGVGLVYESRTMDVSHPVPVSVNASTVVSGGTVTVSSPTPCPDAFPATRVGVTLWDPETGRPLDGKDANVDPTGAWPPTTLHVPDDAPPLINATALCLDDGAGGVYYATFQYASTPVDVIRPVPDDAYDVTALVCKDIGGPNGDGTYDPAVHPTYDHDVPSEPFYQGMEDGFLDCRDWNAPNGAGWFYIEGLRRDLAATPELAEFVEPVDVTCSAFATRKDAQRLYEIFADRVDPGADAPFRVWPLDYQDDDPFGLDEDGNGIACDSNPIG